MNREPAVHLRLPAPTAATASANATLIYPVTIASGTTWIQPITPPRPQTSLEWLDSEVEKICAIARNPEGDTT